MSAPTADLTAGTRSRTLSPTASTNASQPLPSVSVVIPTYREAENLPGLLRRLEQVKNTEKLKMEVIIVDDNSQDGTSEAVEEFGQSWVRLCVRVGRRGLSSAVCEGLELARNDAVVVMDADLSHPPEKVKDLLASLADGAEFVFGSRYVKGGTTDDDWGFLRWANSKVATLLARPLTHARDPMSGFFALWRRSLESRNLDPVGYKIGLELIVKCEIQRLVEVPIHFTDRVLGESKLSLKQQLLYLKHLRRLYRHKFGGFTEFAQFAVVGASGVIVNLVILRLLLVLKAETFVAVAGAIAVSMVTNFLLNRRFTFAGSHTQPMVRQFLTFCASSAVGATANYSVTMFLGGLLADWPMEVPAMGGIAAGLIFNFIGCRFLVFRRRHVRPQAPHTEPKAPRSEKQ